MLLRALPLKILLDICFPRTTEDIFMDHRKRRPVYFHFDSHDEMVNLYYKIELKFFLHRLMYRSLETERIITLDGKK